MSELIISDISLNEGKVEKMPKNVLSDVSKTERESIFGGDCSYSGSSYSPGSVIGMYGGVSKTCVDGWFTDYWV